MRTLIVGVAAALGAAAALHAEIAVEIVNLPAEVFSFEPVYVLYSVANTGSAPVYLPAEGGPGYGPALYFARAGEVPRPDPFAAVAERVFLHSVRNMWLAPGEKWLFYEDVGGALRVLEGELVLQAVMSGGGRCDGHQVFGRHAFPLEPLYLETSETGVRRARVYRCWEGEVRSRVREVSVRRSTASGDRAAHDYLMGSRALRNDPESDTWWLGWSPDPSKLAASSHYTYAIRTRRTASTSEMKLAVDSQPDNPLNPWVMGAIARDALDRRSSCWSGEPLGFEIEIDDLELPVGVWSYLQQYEWYLENRHCPRVVEERQRKAQK